MGHARASRPLKRSSTLAARAIAVLVACSSNAYALPAGDVFGPAPFQVALADGEATAPVAVAPALAPASVPALVLAPVQPRAPMDAVRLLPVVPPPCTEPAGCASPRTDRAVLITSLVSVAGSIVMSGLSVLVGYVAR